MSLLDTIDKTRKSLDSVPDDKKAALVDSLMSLVAKLLDNVMAFRDVPDNFQIEIHPAFLSQLQAAEKRTEKAADDIMTQAERIMNALAGIEGSGKAEVQQAVNKIFEACSFQDLVAQHLNEIKRLMERMESDMADLANSMSNMGSDGYTGTAPVRKKKPERSDSHLLNGPLTKI